MRCALAFGCVGRCVGVCNGARCWTHNVFDYDVVECHFRCIAFCLKCMERFSSFIRPRLEQLPAFNAQL